MSAKIEHIVLGFFKGFGGFTVLTRIVFDSIHSPTYI
jgi:hypothetical protein